MGVDIQKVITIDAVIDEANIMMDVHTHGLEKYSHQNLAVWAPSIYRVSAGRLLNSLADAVVNKGEVFRAGENCKWGEWDRFTLEDGVDIEGLPVLRIVPVVPECEICGEG